jgi:hypothetical protein
MDIYFESEMAKAEAELRKVESAGNDVPTDIVARYLAVSTAAMAKIVSEKESIAELIGPIPEDFSFSQSKPAADDVIQAVPNKADEKPAAAASASENGVPPSQAPAESSIPPEPQPKVEEMDTDGSGLPPTIVAPDHPKNDDVDTVMNDVEPTEDAAAPQLEVVAAVNGEIIDGDKLSAEAADYDQTASRRTTPSPSQMEEDDETEEEEVDLATLETVREYTKTPPLDDLPDYTLRPWYTAKRVRKSYDLPNGLGSFILRQMQDEMTVKLTEQEAVKRDFKQRYDSYLRFTLSDDPTAAKSRDHFASTSAPITTTGKPSVGAEAKPEGGRRAASRFSTELDMDYVIQQSIREHQERQEREARAQKEKHRSEKEAVIPQMYWSDEERDRELYFDNAGLLPVEKLVATWQVLPPVINFTEEEAEQFEKAYLENPKQWGYIAKNVPSRDFKACIQYYYSKKKDLNLKEKLKKQPRKRKKGRGKQRSSALVSELGNTENEPDENQQENGENGERRRPRRAAAPTWGYEATPAVDSDGTTSTAPSGRRGAAAKGENGADKPEVKKGRRSRATKEKEAKTPKPAQTLAPNPLATTPTAARQNRSRSNSRAQGPATGQEWSQPPAPGEVGASRFPNKLEVPPGGMQPPMPPPAQKSPLANLDPVPPPGPSMSDVMAPPTLSLRPEPPPLPQPPTTTIPSFELGQQTGPPERIRTPQQASSYWSVSESNDFPGLLRAFGTDWGSIAAHMQTKTAVMVCFNV